MTVDSQGLVDAIHQAPDKIILAISGGGSLALGQLIARSGASRTILEAVVPYSEQALVDWLGGRPGHFCSAQTARAMAMAGLLRAYGYLAAREPDVPLAGVSCTASLASDRPKRGPHRAHLAIQSIGATTTYSIDLEKGARTRQEEEQLVAQLVLNMVAEAVGIEARLELKLRESDTIETSNTPAPAEWQDLLLKKVDAVRTGGESSARAERVGGVIFPGAFNPMHAGHRGMVRVAEKQLGMPVELEISIENVEKPVLDYYAIARRTDQFPAEQVVWLTRAKTFLEKSTIFPGATFVVGVDTLRRIADPRYYENDSGRCLNALEQIAERGCRFLVFGRDIGTGFIGLGDLMLPDPLAAICQSVPPGVFREDISSTKIRRSGQW